MEILLLSWSENAQAIEMKEKLQEITGSKGKQKRWHNCKLSKQNEFTNTAKK